MGATNPEAGRVEGELGAGDDALRCTPHPGHIGGRSQRRLSTALLACHNPEHSSSLSPSRPCKLTANATFTAIQVELVKDGKPYVMFGDGTLAACKPISEQDLAAFITDCVQQVRSGG